MDEKKNDFNYGVYPNSNYGASYSQGYGTNNDYSNNQAYQRTKAEEIDYAREYRTFRDEPSMEAPVPMPSIKDMKYSSNKRLSQKKRNKTMKRIVIIGFVLISGFLMYKEFNQDVKESGTNWKVVETQQSTNSIDMNNLIDSGAGILLTGESVIDERTYVTTASQNSYEQKMPTEENAELEAEQRELEEKKLLEQKKIDWVADALRKDYGIFKQEENESNEEYVKRMISECSKKYNKFLRDKYNAETSVVMDLVKYMRGISNALYEYRIFQALEAYDPVKYSNLTHYDMEIDSTSISGKYRVTVRGEVVSEQSLNEKDSFFSLGINASGLANYCFEVDCERYAPRSERDVRYFSNYMNLAIGSMEKAYDSEGALRYSPGVGFQYESDLNKKMNVER